MVLLYIVPVDVANKLLIRPFLLEHRAEVKDMLLTEYNEAEAMKLFFLDGERKGRKEGRKEGRNEGDIARMRDDAMGMYAEGIAPDVIARIQKTSVDNVWKMLGVVNKVPDTLFRTA